MRSYLVNELTHYCNITLKKCIKLQEVVIDFYDFTFMLEGSMTYIADGKKIVINKNDAIFLKPGTVRFRPESNEPVAYVSFNFIPYPGVTFPFDEYIPNCITKNLRKLVHIYPGTHLTHGTHAKEKVTNILNYILIELLDTAESKTDNSHIKKILKYIDSHIGEKVTLQTVSDEMNLSKEYVSALFKKEMGKTLTDYVNEQKLLLAKELILSHKMSLSDVALQIGFENYNYFTRLFKRQFEISPIALKKKSK